MSICHRAALIGIGLLFTPSSSITAQQVTSASLTSHSGGMLVTSADVTACPYEFIGPVSVNMRATWIGRNELDQDRIAEKLSKAGRKLKADAVVLVTVGQSHFTVMSVRSTPITGRAVRFIDRDCASKL